MQQARRPPLGRHCARQGLADQMFSHARRHGVADDLPGVQILVTSKVEPTLLGRDIGDIGQPDLSRMRTRKVLGEQVFSHRQGVARVHYQGACRRVALLTSGRVSTRTLGQDEEWG